MMFGTHLEVAIEKAIAPKQGKGKSKPLSEAQVNSRVQKVLAAWLGEKEAPKRYRDPMSRFKKE